jgi:hypothetical protein
MATLFCLRRRPSFYHWAIIPCRLRRSFKGRASFEGLVCLAGLFARQTAGFVSRLPPRPVLTREGLGPRLGV